MSKRGTSFLGIKFVPEFGWGNMAAIVVFLFIAGVAWSGLKSQADANTLAVKEMKDIVAQTATQLNSVGNRTTSIETAILYIEPALRRIEDKVSRKN